MAYDGKKTNRLDLDFSIPDAIGRSEFINNYTTKEQFIRQPLTKTEIETCANYVLWGRDEDGLNGVQKKDFEIETKNKTWAKKKEESLDALIENPAFNEDNILPKYLRLKNSKETFSRKEALTRAPEEIKKIYISLFRQIDKTELIINFYEINSGKRENPPRDELLNRFTPDEHLFFREKAKKLSPQNFLKLKHLLVDLRKQQYSLKDLYTSFIKSNVINMVPLVPMEIDFENEISVFPLGVVNGQPTVQKIFRNFSELIPENFSEEDLVKVSKIYWEKQSAQLDISNSENLYFSFKELEHVYNLFHLYFEVLETNEEIEKQGDKLISTLMYYIECADLSETYREILELKIEKKKNQEIVELVNQKFGKTYTANYISTIFRQKIIPQINKCAALHEEIISKIFFEEEFKKCNCCGRILLRSSNYFVRKSRAKDGLANKCKRCDKDERILKKENR